MSGLTLFEKLWRQHLVTDVDDVTGLVLIDRILLHERTGGVALRSLVETNRPIVMPGHVFATMDHVVDTRPGRTDRTTMPAGTAFIHALRDEATQGGIRLFDLGDPGQGIVHVISPEQAIVLPGLTLVCPDSHTCTQGAIGALAWGIGSSEAEHALATGTLRVRKPKAMRVTVDGALAPDVTAKDLALFLLARFGADGAKGHIVEYAGAAVRALPIEGRLTLCNLATEFSAFGAIMAPDEVTIEYLKGRRFAPAGMAWETAVDAWRGLASDADAVFDAELAIDASEVRPMVTWGTNPQQAIAIGASVPGPSARTPAAAHARALDYMGLSEGEALSALAIGGAFIGSCTNARLSDLRRAAAVLDGRRVANGVRAICVPGSSEVKRQAEAEGLDAIFRAAGFEWRESGCSMCFFAGGESFAAGERVISTTNRNFESRQGPGTRTHLAAPEVVAASAVAGRIVRPADLG